MLKDPMLILAEAMDLDNVDNQDSVEDSDAVREVKAIEELEESLLYTEEMIPVFMTSDNKYVVEYDILHKLIESKQYAGEYCDEEKALKLLESHNNLNSPLYVLIESENSIKANLEILKKQLKNEKNPKNKAIIKKRIDDTTAVIKNLRLKEKIIKKKSK